MEEGDTYSVGDATFKDSDDNFYRYIQNRVDVDDNGFAQNLANQLNVEVYAPTNYLWATPEGNQ